MASDTDVADRPQAKQAGLPPSIRVRVDAAKRSYLSASYAAARRQNIDLCGHFAANGPPIWHLRYARYAAVAAYRCGDLAGSETGFRQALRLAESSGNDEQAVFALNHLGNTVRALGRIGEAATLFERGADLAQTIGSLEGRCRVVGSLGVLLDHIGDVHSAVVAYEQYLTIAEQVRDLRRVGRGHNHLLRHALRLGHLTQARDHLQQAQRAVDSTRDGELRLTTELHRARILLAEDDLTGAHTVLLGALKLAIAAGNPKRIADTRVRLARLEIARRDVPAAFGWLHEAETALHGINYTERRAEIARLQAQAYKRLGFPALSFACYCRALALYTRIVEGLQEDRRDRYGERFTPINALLTELAATLKNRHRLTGDELNELRTACGTLEIALFDDPRLPGLSRFLKQLVASEQRTVKAEVENRGLRTQLSELETQARRVEQRVAAGSVTTNDLEILQKLLPQETAERHRIAWERRILATVFNGLRPMSQSNLILCDTLLGGVDDALETCIFLLMQVIERELRESVFAPLRPHLARAAPWKVGATRRQTKLRFEAWLRSEPAARAPTLGDMSYVIEQARMSTRRGTSARDEPVVTAIAAILERQHSGSVEAIYTLLSTEFGVGSKTYRLVELRNRVAHADEENLHAQAPEVASVRTVERIKAMLSVDVPQFLRLMMGLKENLKTTALGPP